MSTEIGRVALALSKGWRLFAADSIANDTTVIIASSPGCTPDQIRDAAESAARSLAEETP